MAPPLCIFHAFCADGFGAAWVVRRALGDAVEFHGASYGQEPPDVAGRDVIMVDFSYKRPVLDAMAKNAHSILILDHHKTAAEDLAGLLAPPSSYEAWRAATEGNLSRNVRVAALFDMDRSGAGISWDYFNPGERRPYLINRLEDRDLWRFQYEDTRSVQAAVFSYPYDFMVWDRLMEPLTLYELRTEGEAIERQHHKDIAELVGATRRTMTIGGHVVPVANLPYTLTSDAGHLMAQGQPFAACYLDTPKGRTFSLRSTDAGIDVSEIAKGYGGGGHRNAAGFIREIGWEGDAGG
jgi:oligoribonuclease NrnB/cAMP/cGMP phosphodiesterase (DHH superfamily)